jgi:hypothetical protein
MKITPARAGIILLSSALMAALWQLWKNQQDLDELREEAAKFKTAQAAPSGPSVRQRPEIPVAGGPLSGPSSRRRSASADADFAELPEEERAAFLQHWKEQMEKKRAAEEAAKALAQRNKGPEAASYAGGRATGPPDAGEHGNDSSNAWCPAPQSGREWLKLSYGRPVEIKEIAIHETYATGALSRVVATMPDGKEKVLWAGQEPVEKPPVQRIVQVPAGVRSDQIRIELDTTRTGNWQEIDAVELVGRDGSRQWAKEAEGSSYWGSGNSGRTNGLGLNLELDSALSR